MNPDESIMEPERYELNEAPRYHFSISRRAFVQSVSAGILITAYARPTFGQRGSDAARAIGGRFHIDEDGVVTAFTSKVEVGQGSRTEISQAVAEELDVPLSQVRLVMADTSIVPNDGGTYGSQTTPRTIPTVREAAASARELLCELAAKQWGVDAKSVTMRDGVLSGPGGRSMTLADLVAKADDVNTAIASRSGDASAMTPPESWTVLGQPLVKAGARDIATGSHRYPSDIKRPGMAYGKVLRPPSYGATLNSVDLDAAKGVDGAQAVRDGDFVGCVAATSYAAQQALDRMAATAQWTAAPHPSSAELFEYLKTHTGDGSGRYRSRGNQDGDVDAAFAQADRVFRASYEVPYIQHAPMETRAAVAEWDAQGHLTVWTGTQRPFGVRGELARAFAMPADKIRVVVPDTGGGFGGKHTGDPAVEAARLAKAAGRPVSLQWTRDEEFMWAYFRPAGLLEAAASIDSDGNVTGWDFTNYNSGTSALECPYTFANKRVQFQYCDSPLREGSYRGLAATANNFAREAFIDQLAGATRQDPLAFRLAHLDNDRLKGVLTAAAERFGWGAATTRKGPGVGYGLACGTEKGSYIATCAEVNADAGSGRIAVRRLCAAFDCGRAQNPRNLRAQIEGSLVMGLGAALRESIEFEGGKLLNGHFKQYEVPRFKDVPEIEVVLVEPPGVSTAGAGETPLIALAPAVANAVYQATGSAPTKLPLPRNFA